MGVGVGGEGGDPVREPGVVGDEVTAHVGQRPEQVGRVTGQRVVHLVGVLAALW